MALDHMGLGSQRKFGPSRLGMSLGESRVTDMNERAVKNDLLETKKVQRLGRRAYRAALRGQDSSAYLQGLKALEDMKAVNGTTGAGIKMAGTDQAGLEKHIGNTRAQIDSFNGKSLDNNGTLVQRPGSRILGNGSGATQQDSKASSNGGEWVNVASQDQAPAGGYLSARIGKPSFTEQDVVARELSADQGAFGDKTFQVPGDSRARFAEDLANSELIKRGDRGALSRAMLRGRTRFGLSEKDILGHLNRKLESANAITSPASRLLSR